MSRPSAIGNFPANPLTKPGYVLEFYDEFDGSGLDAGRWFPYYLPHWSSREQSAPSYRMEGGSLVLQIQDGQQPWCPEFDGRVKCSSIQSGQFSGQLGSREGQHRFSPACRVRQVQHNLKTYTPQYGFFEVRARAIDRPANHVSVWMIGYEDLPDRSGEIAIFEIMGTGISASSSQVGYGVHPWGDPLLKDQFYVEPLEIDSTQFHVYALEWTPTQLDFYVDNQKINAIHQSPSYPMQFMLSIYERAEATDKLAVVAAGPAEFEIDYFRAYQPISGYPEKHSYHRIPIRNSRSGHHELC